MSNPPTSFLQLTSTLAQDGNLTLALIEKEMPTPAEDQVIICVEATPINPSDLGVMFGVADVSAASTTGKGHDAKLVVPVAEHGMKIMQGRVGDALPLGNEGAGTVVAAGEGELAQSLMGKNVAAMGGSMYAQYRVVPASMCIPLKPEHDAKDGASSFVNPMTALSFIETMKMEGHKAIVHTAAASNLGLMLNRICQADGVDLINIVRKESQIKILQEMGAKYIVNSEDPKFAQALCDAIFETNATLAFDATGGGKLASDILMAMEQAAARTPSAYSIYGSTHHKQVYLYGSLDMSPTTLSRGYGMAWGVGGWLLPNFLAKAGMEVMGRLSQRVINELTTTFKSHYSEEISLTDVLQADVAKRYQAKKTGEKFLIRPQN